MVKELPKTDIRYASFRTPRTTWVLSWRQALKLSQTRDTKLLNIVHCPQDNAPATLDLITQNAYSAVMWAVTELLVGSMGIYQVVSSATNTSTIFTEITTDIVRTSLLGTSDLDLYFNRHHALYAKPNDSNKGNISSQRLLDIALAGNRTLDVLIPRRTWHRHLRIRDDTMHDSAYE
jgi:hypothetical protein